MIKCKFGWNVSIQLCHDCITWTKIITHSKTINRHNQAIASTDGKLALSQRKYQYTNSFNWLKAVTAFHVIVSLRIQSECGEIRTRITPNMDTFYGVTGFGKLAKYVSRWGIWFVLWMCFSQSIIGRIHFEYSFI